MSEQGAGTDRVGRVVGDSRTNTQEFRVIVDDEAYLAVDDLVVVYSDVPGLESPLATYGVVTESESTYEGVSYETDVRRIGDSGVLPAERIRTASVSITRMIPEVWTAPLAGEVVNRATGPSRDDALYVDDMGRSMPVGLARDGSPVYLDLDFFDGTKGGHMSISGVSGVATKTTFAFFFLRMLTGGSYKRKTTDDHDLIGHSLQNTRILVFNVKGQDLLWLDKPSLEFSDIDREMWDKLGVEPTPFQLVQASNESQADLKPNIPSVSFWAPPRSDSSADSVLPNANRTGVTAFYWTPREFIDKGLLQYVFTDASDSRNQLQFLLERVQAQLRRWAVNVAGTNGAVVLRHPSERESSQEGNNAVAPRSGEQQIHNLEEMVSVVRSYIDPDDIDPHPDWVGSIERGTVLAFLRRLEAASRPNRLGSLVRSGSQQSINRNLATVTVVDINSLHELAQRFVVGVLLKDTFEEKEETGKRTPLSIIVLDEMNKYAPAQGESPIKDMLIDIAQRGRSLGVLLIGAQQSASRVAPDVMENASIRVAGRLDPAESERNQYGWMLPSTRARAKLLKPGTMVLGQPAVPLPVVLNFPRTPWATRAEERAAETDTDLFENLDSSLSEDI
ncbi:MAG: ATP-binding protein [Dehalococcoidia bacterium]|jgi:DNA helicase HerA-like ATPase|nr:ATP-binding protein [Dehalococcoidia bacterium]